MVTSLPPLAVCLMGPTAAGKTAIAVALARRLPVGVISVDSAMVYRRMDIGSGKPPAEVLAEVPHRLVDVREPWESYSAGEFAGDARTALLEVAAGGRVPLLVGGTFLYFRSLLQGLSELPPADPQIREALDRRAAAEGWPALHAELTALDPRAGARIHPADRQRIQRALEVYAITGAPLSSLQGRAQPAADCRFLRVAITSGERQSLHARIELRFRDMLARGFVDEVAALMAIPQMQAGCPSMRAVGYRQLWQMLAGECDLTEAENRALAATRQLARRQLTWLRQEQCELQFDMDSRGLLGDIEAALRARGALDAKSGPSS